MSLQGSIAKRTMSAIGIAGFIVGHGTAAEAQVPVDDCRAAVGAFLSAAGAAKDGAGTKRVRSLLSLPMAGHALLVQSNEEGVNQSVPFSSGQGAWRCISVDAEQIRFHATVLDFTFTTSERPDPQFARRDLVGTYNIADDTIERTETLYFLPIDADPLTDESLPDGVEAGFAAARIGSH